MNYRRYAVFKWINSIQYISAKVKCSDWKIIESQEKASWIDLRGLDGLKSQRFVKWVILKFDQMSAMAVTELIMVNVAYTTCCNFLQGHIML
jgi:hypothetical protein